MSWIAKKDFVKALQHLDRAKAWLTQMDEDPEPAEVRMRAARAEVASALTLLKGLEPTR